MDSRSKCSSFSIISALDDNIWASVIFADRVRRVFTKDLKRFPPILPGLRDTPTDIRVQANPDDDNRFNLDKQYLLITSRSNFSACFKHGFRWYADWLYAWRQLVKDFWPSRSDSTDACFYKTLRSTVQSTWKSIANSKAFFKYFFNSTEFIIELLRIYSNLIIWSFEREKRWEHDMILILLILEQLRNSFWSLRKCLACSISSCICKVLHFGERLF